jgi:hypothetical protein
MASRWGGRKVKRLAALVVATKGSTCHLCELEGADSPDHNPPRADLLAAGVLYPDQLAYLWPAHRLCNVRRKRRPITPALKVELRARRLEDLRVARATAAAVRSSRFAGRGQ